MGRAYQGRALSAAERVWAGRWPSTVASGAAAAVAFSVLAYATQKGLTQQFDWKASWAVHAHAAVGLTAVMVMLTTLADPVMAIAFSTFVGWLAFRRGDNRAAITVSALVWIAGGLNFVLRHLFHRQRPNLWEAAGGFPDYSFPSWHATAVVAVGGTIALVIGRLYPRARIGFGLLITVLAVAICISRIYLGMHWTTDVLAGACVGWILLLGAATALELRPFSPEPTR